MVGDLGIVAGRMEAASRLLDAGSPRVSTEGIPRVYSFSIKPRFSSKLPSCGFYTRVEVLAPETANEQ